MNLYVIVLSISSDVWSSVGPWATMPFVNSLWLIRTVPETLQGHLQHIFGLSLKETMSQHLQTELSP